MYYWLLETMSVSLNYEDMKLTGIGKMDPLSTKYEEKNDVTSVEGGFSSNKIAY